MIYNIRKKLNNSFQIIQIIVSNKKLDNLPETNHPILQEKIHLDQLNQIEWVECEDVYKPTEKPIQEFMAERGISSEFNQVYILEEALTDLTRHLEADVSVEHGGILFGQAYTDSEYGVYVEITAAVAAQKKLDELSGNSKQILTRIEIIPPLGFVLGSRHIFSVKAFDQNNQEMSIGQVAWHTTGGKIDRDGTFQAGQTPGRFAVTATVGSIKDEIYITVVEPKKLTSLVVTPSKVEIKLGDKKTFSVKGLDQHHREMFIEQVQWQTNGGNIDSNGTFKAGETPGCFIVTATVETIKGQAFVTVTATIDRTVETIKGETSVSRDKTKVDEPYKYIIGLSDRVSQQKFVVGDKVYFCIRCQLGYHEDSWEYLNCKCDQCQTLEKVDIYILPSTFISKAINAPSASSSTKEIDLGALRGTNGNGSSSSIREAINNWTDIPDREEDSGFRFIYTENQAWGSREYSAKRIIVVRNTEIEVENFDGSRSFLPIRLIGNILSPIGRSIWQSAIFLANSIIDTLLEIPTNSTTNSATSTSDQNPTNSATSSATSTPPKKPTRPQTHDNGSLYNPALTEYPRHQLAPVIPFRQDSSILEWLESIGRLLPYDYQNTDINYVDDSEEISELMEEISLDEATDLLDNDNFEELDY